MTDLGLAAEGLWTAAKGELQLQMTKATYDTWVKGTEVVEWSDDGRVVIGCANAFTRDWLDNRLKTTVERVLMGIVGHPVRASFVVTETSPSVVEKEGEERKEKGTVAVKFYEFDPMRRGYLQMPKYCEWFWQPFLGCVAYATYRFLRSLDKQNEGWGEWHFVTVERIAATLKVSRQAITGVLRRKKGKEYWQKGAFDRLQEAAIAQIEPLGSGRNLSYRISCLNALPLLVPEQVETLPELLQSKHAAFLKECAIEFEEWQQLELPSLVQK